MYRAIPKFHRRQNRSTYDKLKSVHEAISDIINRSTARVCVMGIAKMSSKKKMHVKAVSA
jgi:adenine-specific DNA methylase